MVMENKIRQGLVELGCAADAFAIIADVSKSRLSRAFCRLQDFDGPEAARLLGIISDLRGLAEDARPFPISFRDPMAIRALLHHRQSGVRWNVCITGTKGFE